MNATGPRTPATDRTALRGYLRELGIDVWVRRDRRHPEGSDGAGHAKEEQAPVDRTEPTPVFANRGFRTRRGLARFAAAHRPPPPGLIEV
ncbi:MAG: hypothetical protein F4X99_08445 [Gammaproteobacteria bacterium]|nr:hypothetical protein [Gammaproteobacteria bacterium]